LCKDAFTVWWDVPGAFNKFQDYVLNTMTVNHTFLTVMLLFNIFSLQFTTMFTLFYKSAGTRSIKFFIGSCRNFWTSCLQVICSVVQTDENHLELNLDCMANAVAVLSPFFQFS